MAGATAKDANKYGSMTHEALRDISYLIESIETIEDTPQGFYLHGTLEVRNHDGYRVGYIKSYEDWWIFVPDYKDTVDE